MTRQKNTVLLVEDSNSNALTYIQYMRDENIDYTHVSTGKKALPIIESKIYDIVLLDLTLPDMNGMDLLKYAGELGIADRFIILTGTGTLQVAVDAIKLGAYDYLPKPISRDKLLVVVRNCLKSLAQQNLLQTLRQERNSVEPIKGFIGKSPVMQVLYRSLRSVAASNATVMITGDSGTGKEVCAHALHSLSARQTGPFEALNCAAIPKDLLESEIFGHVKGAFTGAISDTKGAAVRANGGTFFLDEICELDISLQAKLLRFIQSSEVKPLGGDKAIKVDIRIIAATNRNPIEEVRKGTFREDLYYRLNVVSLHLSPLRNREEDVLDIAQSLLEKISRQERRDFQGFTAEAKQVLMRHQWPGNVRELMHCIHRCVVMNEGKLVTADMLENILHHNVTQLISDSSHAESAGMPQPLSLKPLREIELDYIREAMRVCNNVVPQAAALLDISPSTIYRRLKDIGDTP